MIEIFPGIITTDAETFKEHLLFAGFWQPGMTAHVDILDGSMFGEACFCDPMAVAKSPIIAGIELHCMVRNPLPIIENWKRLVPNVKRAIVHAEIDQPLDPIFAKIRSLDIETGLALCPETSVDMIEALADVPDKILIMGVNPGASGRKFIGEPILAKIRRLHLTHPDLSITVDGGVTIGNAGSIIEAGATSLVATSAIWNTLNPKKSYEQFFHHRNFTP